MERGRSPWAGGALETRWALRNPWGSAVPPPLELLLWRKLATTSGRKHQVRVNLQRSWTLQMNTVYLRCLQGDLLIACFVYSLTVILNIFAWRCFIFPKLRFCIPPNSVLMVKLNFDNQKACLINWIHFNNIYIFFWSCKVLHNRGLLLKLKHGGKKIWYSIKNVLFNCINTLRSVLYNSTQ